MMLEPKVQRVMDWQESLSTLNDESFFSIIRMYLGEVKTPYNKQKLIEALGAFIGKDENKKAIVSLLTERDLKILTFISLIQEATEQSIIKFFGTEVNQALLSDHIVNLKERLLIYSHKRISDNQYILSINPILEDTLKPYLVKRNLFTPEVFAEKRDSSAFFVSPQFLASFICFVYANKDLCKHDGSFKKGIANKLREIYGGNNFEPILQLINTGLCNLGIFHDTDKSIVVDFERLRLFCKLDYRMQLIYIAVASNGHFSRSLLQSTAQLLLDTFMDIPVEGFTLSKIVQLSIILNNNGGQAPSSGGRFAQILHRSEAVSSTLAGNEIITTAAIESSVKLGILYCNGINVSGEEVYSVSPLFESCEVAEDMKVLSIDAGFSVSIMPGLTMEPLISLMQFLDVVKYDTVVMTEISRQSVLRGFDAGFTPDSICSLLERYSYYEIPQNLRISIEEWYTSYTSASLYKGYILKVRESNTTLVESNPTLSPHIEEILAPGVYLLDFSSDAEAELIISKSGLNSVGNIKTTGKDREITGLPLLYIGSGRKSWESYEQPASVSADIDRQNKILDEYKSYVNTLNVDNEQKMGLIERINGRIILSKEQLRPESVRFEKLEAYGMDYTGKIHVIESAISSGCMIEMDLDGHSDSLIGYPSNLNKKSGNAEFVLMQEPDHQPMIVAVSAASRIKKLRNSLYC